MSEKMIFGSKESLNDSQKPRAFMLVGKYGTGKSVMASTFPSPMFVFDFDNGIEVYRDFCEEFDYMSFDCSVHGWVLYEKTLREVTRIQKEEKRYKTVVYDSSTKLADIAMEKAMQIDPKKDKTEGPLWNVHYKIVKNLVGPRLRQFVNFTSMGANAVMVSHERVVQDQESGAVIGIEPILPGDLSVRAPGDFGEVYACFSKNEKGVVKYFIRTVPIGFTPARSRMSGPKRRLPDVLPNSYQEIQRAMEMQGEENA